MIGHGDGAYSGTGHDSLEFLLLPDADDLNTFVTTRVGIAFDWRHLDRLLNKTCVDQYLVEYGAHRYEEEAARSKRESVASSSRVSPPLSPSSTSFSASLPDDCEVYEAKLIAVVSSGPRQQLVE